MFLYEIERSCFQLFIYRIEWLVILWQIEIHKDVYGFFGQSHKILWVIIKFISEL